MLGTLPRIMPTLQELELQLANLNQSITDGVRQVTVGGETTVLNPTDSLIRARNDLKQQIADLQAAEAGRARLRVRKLYYAGRGY